MKGQEPPEEADVSTAIPANRRARRRSDSEARIMAKIEASRRQPYASKVFANEILHGAPQLDDYLRGQVHRWVQDKAKVIDRWVAAGKMQPVAAPHLFFVLWAATQTYADFESQIRAVLKRRRLAPADYAAGTELI